MVKSCHSLISFLSSQKQLSWHGQFMAAFDLLFLFGPLKPISSLSSPFWGHRICSRTMARIIILKTKIHPMINIGVNTHPKIWMALDPNALPTAKVAVIRAVFGKMNEYQVMSNVIPPLRTHDQWAPIDIRKNQYASLLRLARSHALDILSGYSTPRSIGSSSWPKLGGWSPPADCRP